MSSFGKANAAIAAAGVFLLLSTCGAYFAFVHLQTSQEWVRHTLDVQHALDYFASTAARAGRLRAEYVDSGDPALLSRYAEAVVNVRSGLSSIERLTSDNQGQRASCKKLAELTGRRIALMEEAISLKRSGKSSLESQDAVSRQIVANAETADSLLQAMGDEEQRLLAERQKREGTSFSVIAGTLLTSLFFALVLFLIHHQLLTDQVRERLRAETSQRNLSARLLTLQDEERRKFARELHDSVGQQLAAMKMALSMLEHKLPGDSVVQDCLKLSDEAIAETRTISHLLHPPLLDEAGLNSAIRWFVEGFAKRSGIQVNLQIQDRPERLESSVELVLFRALQETLTNVHRHSGAKQADVSLHSSEGHLILSVRDHGRGISAVVLKNLADQGSGGGVGLAGMTERLREIGGRLQISSHGNGTEVVVRVPARHRQPPIQFLSSVTQEVSG